MSVQRLKSMANVEPFPEPILITELASPLTTQIPLKMPLSTTLVFRCKRILSSRLPIWPQTTYLSLEMRESLTLKWITSNYLKPRWRDQHRDHILEEFKRLWRLRQVSQESRISSSHPITSCMKAKLLKHNQIHKSWLSLLQVITKEAIVALNTKLEFIHQISEPLELTLEMQANMECTTTTPSLNRTYLLLKPFKWLEKNQWVNLEDQVWFKVNTIDIQTKINKTKWIFKSKFNSFRNSRWTKWIQVSNHNWLELETILLLTPATHTLVAQDKWSFLQEKAKFSSNNNMMT